MSRAKLQLALDTLSIDQAIELVEKVGDQIDIIEAGTPFIMEEGLHIVRKLRERFPHKTILADTKIADGARLETAAAIRAGADIVTVLGAVEEATIRDCIAEAHQNGVQVLVDMIAVRDLEERGRLIDEMGADYICVHNGYDTKALKDSPLDELLRIKAVVRNARIAVAGGITPDNLPAIMKEGADLVVVGTVVVKSADPAAMCRKLREWL